MLTREKDNSVLWGACAVRQWGSGGENPEAAPLLWTPMWFCTHKMPGQTPAEKKVGGADVGNRWSPAFGALALGSSGSLWSGC